MSIDNPENFDYLKVQEFIPGNDESDHKMGPTYPLASVQRGTVHIRYSDNSTYQISFDVKDDGTPAFKALHENSWIYAGEQIFEIKTVTKKYQGSASTTITADQIVNAEFQNVIQPRAYMYKAKDNTGSTSTNSNKIYVTLDDLLSWFWNGATHSEMFDFQIHGWFPRRPMDNPHNITGKQLLQKIVQTWPGSVAIGWGKTIHFYGFEQARDEKGNLVSVRNIDTGLRFDAMYNTKDINVKRDASKICNAIRVKSATVTVQPPKIVNPDGSTSESQELTITTFPYFKSFLAVSEDSVRKYGIYASTTILDNGFTNPKAALAAAREKMVVEPDVTVTATIDNPGRTEAQPVPGHIYTIGIMTENTVRHVILRGYDWYPFNPEKGASLTLSSVDAGIVDNLRTIILHDIELSPQMTSFEAVTSDGTDGTDAGDVDEGGDTGGDTGQTGDDYAGLPTEDTDASTDRPDDAGNGSDTGYPNSNNGSAGRHFEAYLPISDHSGLCGHISRWANLTINKKNKSWDIRVTDDDTMEKLRDGVFTAADANNDTWKHLMKIRINDGTWLGHHGKAQRYYQQSDFYLGQLAMFNSGLITTTSNVFTFRSGVTDKEYRENGTLKHISHKNSKGISVFHDASDEQPGFLATIQAGKYVGKYSQIYHYTSHSQLSKKKDVKKLDKQKALKTILNTDIAEYHYKGDDSGELEASVVIDDVHKKPRFKTPDVFVTKDGTSRKDSVTVGYLVKAVQALQDQITDLKDENKELKKQLNDQS